MSINKQELKNKIEKMENLIKEKIEARKKEKYGDSVYFKIDDKIDDLSNTVYDLKKLYKFYELLKPESENDLSMFIEYELKLKELENLKKEIKEKQRKTEIKILIDNGFKADAVIYEKYLNKNYKILNNENLAFRPITKSGKLSNSSEHTRFLNLFWLNDIELIEK